MKGLLISKKETAEKSKTAITGLPKNLAERFTAFCAFKGRSKAETAALILDGVMGMDKDFLAHEAAQKPVAIREKKAVA